MDYYFGVAAENDIGVGQQREIEESIKPKRPLGKKFTNYNL